MILGIDQPSNSFFGTFLCGADSDPCPLCHPSCNGKCDANSNCVESICAASSGTPIVTGAAAACKCDMAPTDYTTGCRIPCHASCETCSGSAANQCNTCKTAEARVIASGSGTCVCEMGYVYQISPTASGRLLQPPISLALPISSIMRFLTPLQLMICCATESK
jgi:hypothetical protein